ncbi:MAG: O-antigen ligase domain-containing protein [Geminocystis sp.]|nr:O-antigen ligase domain-containing protein [Geminocystis sp.]MDW8117024.1 O-antigen ligase domain-containing protein [Geminocystis sp.]
MSPQAQLALILWLPVVFYIFNQFPPRKAAIVSFIAGFLFLPRKAGFKMPLIPDYKEIFATCYGILIAVAVYDSKVFRRLRFSWVDLPVLVYGFSPIFSSLTNGLGLYDGINSSISQLFQWGLPYFIGRLYLNNPSGFRELAISVVKGGLLYVPLCLYEIRMSPQLHRIVYGYFPHSFLQTKRLGGWRPQVFLQHGLMLGVFMMTATLVAIWLWQSKSVKKIWNIPISWVCAILLVTFILCKSTGAYILFLLGLICLFFPRFISFNLPLPLLVYSGIIVLYLTLSASGNFPKEKLLDLLYSQTIIEPDRVQSFEFRINNEEILATKARERWLFGWGGWGRNRVFEENYLGEWVDVTVTDSLWIIVFGVNGLLGLASVMALLILPVLLITCFRFPPNTWLHPRISPTISLAVSLLLFAIDCLVNNMFNPIFPLISGGLSALFLSPSYPSSSSSRRLLIANYKATKKRLHSFSQ